MRSQSLLLARRLAVGALLCVFTAASWAQTYPNRPIRLVVNFPAGGTTDIMARAFAPRLAEVLGQPVVIDNRGGAGGNVGLEIVVRAAPDGYTLLASSGSPIIVGPHFYKLGFDVERDLVPIAPLGRTVTLLVAHPSLPVKTGKELIAYIRANPNKLNYGSVGTGSTLHLHGERMLRAEKLQATHIPYKGAAIMVNALLANEVQFMFDSGLSIPHIKSGRVRLLGVLTPSPLFPDAPTLADQGIHLVGDALFGVYAPRGTPRAIVERLNREIGRIMQTPEAVAALATFGAEVVTAATPEEFAAIQKRDRDRFGTFIREAGIRLD
jgi:tripartite-type tricarboxylate transporter receptor subunit TctC